MDIKIIHCFGFERIPKNERPVPKELTINCLDIKNPHRILGLRRKTGFDADVIENVMDSRGVAQLLIHVGIEQLMRPDVKEIGVACKSGKHGSVVIANAICQGLHEAARQGYIEFDTRVKYYSQETIGAWLKMQLTREVSK